MHKVGYFVPILTVTLVVFALATLLTPQSSLAADIILPIDTSRFGERVERHANGTQIFEDGTACDKLCRKRLEREQWGELLHELSQSPHRSDQLFVAIIASRAPHLRIDAPSIFESLLNQYPSDAVVLFNARLHCTLNGMRLCEEHNVDTRLQQAAPDNLVVLFPTLIAAHQRNDNEAMLSAVEEMSGRRYQTSYYPENIGIFLETIDRHPAIYERACFDPACARVIAPAQIAQMMNLQHFSPGLSPAPALTAAALDYGMIEEVTSIARAMQEQKNNFLHAAYGRGLEMKILEATGDPAGRLAELETANQAQHEFMFILHRADLRYDEHFRPKAKREMVELTIRYGEIGAMEKRIKRAGLDINNLPPDCLSMDRFMELEALAIEFDIDLVGDANPCEDQLVLE